MNGESYVVRIYRREKKAGPPLRGHDRVLLDGTLEEAEGRRRKYFHGIDELWDLLARPPRRGKRNE